MPFVHWLPKNRIRKYYILFFLLLGLGPKYAMVENQGVLEKAEMYYRGNITESFYRPYRLIRRCLNEHGFDVEFISIDHPGLRKIPLFEEMIRIPALRSLIDWFLLTFIGVSLMTTKRRSV